MRGVFSSRLVPQRPRKKRDLVTERETIRAHAHAHPLALYRHSRPLCLSADYLVHTHTHIQSTERDTGRQARAEAGGRRASRAPPPSSVDGEPLWSMAAPSFGGGRAAGESSATAVAAVATVPAMPGATTTATAVVASRPSCKIMPTQLLPPARANATATSSSGRLADTQVAAADKSHRRKISLPWFRQASASNAAAALARQHTIDTPGSYRNRPTARSVAAVQVLSKSPPCYSKRPSNEFGIS